MCATEKSGGFMWSKLFISDIKSQFFNLICCEIYTFLLQILISTVSVFLFPSLQDKAASQARRIVELEDALVRLQERVNQVTNSNENVLE